MCPFSLAGWRDSVPSLALSSLTLSGQDCCTPDSGALRSVRCRSTKPVGEPSVPSPSLFSLPDVTRSRLLRTWHRGTMPRQVPPSFHLPSYLPGMALRFLRRRFTPTSWAAAGRPSRYTRKVGFPSWAEERVAPPGPSTPLSPLPPSPPSAWSDVQRARSSDKQRKREAPLCRVFSHLHHVARPSLFQEDP